MRIAFVKRLAKAFGSQRRVKISSYWAFDPRALRPATATSRPVLPSMVTHYVFAASRRNLMPSAQPASLLQEITFGTAACFCGAREHWWMLCTNIYRRLRRSWSRLLTHLAHDGGTVVKYLDERKLRKVV